jgi:uncharacterized protein YdeI (YjbR/CyaY-like superfamily)
MRQQGRNVMRSVKINKKELLTIVRENKEKHVKEYAESVADYKTAAVKVAAEHVELATTGELPKIAKIRAMPAAPISYEKEYDRAIRMLELSVDKEIEVEEDVFNQLVLDEWAWKHQFVASASLYKTL